MLPKGLHPYMASTAPRGKGGGGGVWGWNVTCLGVKLDYVRVNVCHKLYEKLISHVIMGVAMNYSRHWNGDVPLMNISCYSQGFDTPKSAI